MKLTNFDNPVMSSWFTIKGARLDSKPYLSGALEARVLLEKLRVEKQPLKELTLGGIEGLINAGRIARTWVTSEHGVPFLSSTDILQADLSNISFIARKAIHLNPKLLIREGWTLITRSGSIGRMAYCRSDMSGMACTEDVLRVLPDPDKILPGYLYAYLSSKFGVPQVTEGTYGAIIQHLEPPHIANLPVPILDEDIQSRVHALVVRAATLRTEANCLLAEQKKSLEEEIAEGPLKWTYLKENAFAIDDVVFSSRHQRLDAFHYIGYVGEAIKRTAKPLIEMKEVANVLRPPIMKRIWVDEGGYEFLGGIELYSLTQKSRERISAKTPNIESFIVKANQVLFQCVGQRYGIFGRPVLANRSLIGKAVSEHSMRIIPHNPVDAGYICVYLATNFGQRFSMQYSSGTSIPVLQEVGARRIKIYWPGQARRLEISSVAEKAWDYRAEANDLEDEARKVVEENIRKIGIA